MNMHLGSSISEQDSNDTPAETTKHVVLTSVAINAKRNETGKNKKKVKSFYSFIVISPAKSGVIIGPSFFSTYCLPLNTAPVKLYHIELKLIPYDSRQFDIKLIIAQEQASGEIFFKTVDIDAEQIAKKRMLVDVKKENIILEPSNYYLGYAFIPKDLKSPFSYRVYFNDSGDGALIRQNGDSIKINKMSDFNYNFPFKVSYITL